MAQTDSAKDATTQLPGSNIIAYVVCPENLRLVPAQQTRAWMEATNKHFANRCLPLLMANQSGWFVLSEHELEVVWDGGDAKESLHVQTISGPGQAPASSHFGYGILTWNMPYLFRTSGQYSLLVRGPSNWPKDGAYPLEGLVETDWAVATFTMNWKMTRANTPVRFEAGEPICMIVPQRRGELESFQASIAPIESRPDIRDGYLAWTASRTQFNQSLAKADGSSPASGQWQKHYFQGTSPDGTAGEVHFVKRNLSHFEHAQSPSPAKVDRTPKAAAPHSLKPLLSYLICSMPRSGSFLLAEALSDTGIAGQPAEYFTRRSQWRQRLNAQHDSYEEFLQKIIARGMTPNRVFGAKTHWYQFEDLSRDVAALLKPGKVPASAFLPEIFPNLHYVHIKREDKLRQAISYARAIQTDVWWKIDGFTIAEKTRPVFNRELIDTQLEEINSHELAWFRFFNESGIRPHVVVYEELVRDLERTVVEVIRYLEIPVPNTLTLSKPRLKQQADGETDEWVRLYLDGK